MNIKHLNKEIIMRAADNTVFSRKKFEVKNFMNDYLRGKDSIKDTDLMAALIGEDNQILLPEEWKSGIDMAKMENKSIRQFIDVIPVKKEGGTFATEAEGNANDELIEFDNEDNFEKAEQDIKFNGVNWNIKPRGSFTAVERSLIEDSAVDLTKVFEKNHADKATKTENKLVFRAIKEGLPVKTLNNVDALTNSLVEDFNPMLENEMVIITNQDGYKHLIPELEYFKDKNGKVKAYLDKYLVETYSNEDLTSSPGTVPVIYGALNRTVKLFDLEKTEMVLIRYPYGIRSRVAIMRGIENFDIKLMPHNTETIYGEITIA